MDTLFKMNLLSVLLSSILIIFLGIVILIKDRNTFYKLVFFFLTLSLSGWLFGTFMLLKSNDYSNVVFWDKFTYCFVVFIPAFLYHFIYKFTKSEDSKYIIYFSYFISFLFLYTLLFTNYFVNEFFVYKWGTHLKAKTFHHIFLFIFFVYSFETYRLLIIYYKKSSGLLKKQASLLFLGFLSFGTIGFTGFLPAYKIGFYPISHFSALFFILVISYAITKYNLLGIRVITSYFLIIILNIVSIIHIFFSSNGETSYLIEVISFLLVLFISYFLQISFSHEIKQSENLKQMSGHLKKAIDKLEFTNKKLKELDKAKNEFLSVAAHQLRTPATAIKGYTAMILDGNFGECDPDVMTALQKVYQANERMTILVEDLLNTSRIETGHLKFEFSKIDVKSILEELESTFEIKAKNSGINFSVTYPKESLQEIIADKNKLREAISNIIDNAIKYTIKGSVKVILEKEENYIKITVKDTGRGMTERTMSNLFKKFSRGEESASEVEGTGLGLFVVKKLVEKHNGTITAESEGLNKGSKFILRLPIEREETIEELNNEGQLKQEGGM